MEQDSVCKESLPTIFPQLAASNCEFFRIFTAKSTFSALSFAKICLRQYFFVILHPQTHAGGMSHAWEGISPLRRKPLLPLQWENAPGEGADIFNGVY